MGYCVYCGGDPDTSDHVPSKVFLDEPYPENLPQVDACDDCNNGFSSDEAYVAALVECVCCDALSPDELERAKIRKMLLRSPAFAQRIWDARTKVDGQSAFNFESERVLKVVRKLARGHAAFELNLPQLDEPTRCWVGPLGSLTTEQIEVFESCPPVTLFPEAGSRAIQRLMVIRASPLGYVFQDWVDVQDGRYRYYARQEPGFVLVRGVIREYLGFEVVWDD